MFKRKAFNRPTIALILAAIVALIVAACGGGSEPTATALPAAPTASPPPVGATPTPAPSPAPTQAGEPKMGGVLPLRTFIPIATNRNSWFSPGGVPHHYVPSMVSSLVTFNPFNTESSSDVIGDLAKSWSVSSDGKVYTFNLEQGVQWHDGTPFSSKDIVSTIDRGMFNHPTDAIPLLKSKFPALIKVDAPNDNTVVLTLSRVSASFILMLGRAHTMMYPAHLADESRTPLWEVVGTGPFRFKAQDGQNTLEVERNPNYFRDGLPYLDGVKWTTITDAALAIAALRTGQILATGGDPDYHFAREGLKRDVPGLQEDLEAVWRVTVYMTNRGFMADKRFRQAISLGINREQYLNVWFQGGTGALGGAMLPPEIGGAFSLSRAEFNQIPGYNPANAAADLVRAKELLKASGYDGTELRSIAPLGYELNTRMGEVFSSLVDQNLGIKTKFVPLVSADNRAAVRNCDFDFAAATAANSVDEPLELINTYIGPGGFSNCGWGRPRDQPVAAAGRHHLGQRGQRETGPGDPGPGAGYRGGGAHDPSGVGLCHYLLVPRSEELPEGLLPAFPICQRL